MNKLRPYLMYAGAIPFILCAFCLFVDINSLPILGDVEHVQSAYALVIASFMAGAHWGQHFNLDGEWERRLPIASNIITVAIWIAFLVFGFKAQMVFFCLAFIGLLFIDYRLFKDRHISKRYFQQRTIVTAIVVLALVVSGISA